MNKAHIPKIFSVTIPLEMIATAARDIYLISMPAMVEVFASTPSSLQRTLTIFLIGSMLAQLLVGPFSDYCGRRAILLTALPIFILGTLVVIFSMNIYILYFGIFLISIGIGFAPTLSKSIVNDVFAKSGDISNNLLTCQWLLFGPQQLQSLWEGI